MGPLTPYQLNVLIPAIWAICRDTGRPARTVAVAARLGLPERSTRRYIHELEVVGAVRRNKIRAGWRLAGKYR